ncbi:MAG: methyltransferase domain-containing protein [Pseudomonadota bacterium]|nr:methyltransferase domain-containing protein [Pseudomonadota bacterium]
MPNPASVDPLVRDHFTARAARYNVSSHWVTDPVLGALTVKLLDPRPTDVLLDVACGTGLVSKEFVGKVARIVGADITEAMFDQARPYVDELVVAAGESLPFADASFDRVVCRQGIQFMRDQDAVNEMFRVLRPGGRACLVHLCAYGESDRAEYFESLRLRNEARKNFYLRADLARLLTTAGFGEVAVHDYVSVEDVDVWSNTGAITDEAREGIRNVYRNASPAFQELHAVQVGDRIVDHMLFGVAIGVKASA